MDIAEMLAREAIRYTAALYTKNGDALDYDAHADVFHPDAEVFIQQTGVTWRGIKEIIEGLRAGGVARGAFEQGNRQRHHLTTAMIEFTSPTTANVKHYIIIESELGIDSTGTYVDEFVKHGDRWLIKKRSGTMEWARPDSRFVAWQKQNEAVAGAFKSGG